MQCRYLKAGEVRGKTDVYSFGVVLLQLITSRPAVDSNKRHIADWVREMLSEGGSGISSVIDHKIRDHCDLVSVRKVAELALRCTQCDDFQARPTMAVVVAELEALQQRDNEASSSAGTSGSAMAREEEDDEPAAVAGVHEVVVQLAEQQ